MYFVCSITSIRGYRMAGCWRNVYIDSKTKGAFTRSDDFAMRPINPLRRFYVFNLSHNLFSFDRGFFQRSCIKYNGCSFVCQSVFYLSFILNLDSCTFLSIEFLGTCTFICFSPVPFRTEYNQPKNATRHCDAKG